MHTQSEASTSECVQEINTYLALAKSIQSANIKSDGAAAKSTTKQEDEASSGASFDQSAPATKKRGRSKKDDKDKDSVASSNRDSNGAGSTGNVEASGMALGDKATYVGETQFLFSHIKQTMKVFVLT